MLTAACSSSSSARNRQQQRAFLGGTGVAGDSRGRRGAGVPLHYEFAVRGDRQSSRAGRDPRVRRARHRGARLHNAGQFPADRRRSSQLRGRRYDQLHGTADRRRQRVVKVRGGGAERGDQFRRRVGQRSPGGPFRPSSRSSSTIEGSITISLRHADLAEEISDLDTGDARRMGTHDAVVQRLCRPRSRYFPGVPLPHSAGGWRLAFLRARHRRMR